MAVLLQIAVMLVTVLCESWAVIFCASIKNQLDIFLKI